MLKIVFILLLVTLVKNDTSECIKNCEEKYEKAVRELGGLPMWMKHNDELAGIFSKIKYEKEIKNFELYVEKRKCIHHCEYNLLSFLDGSETYEECFERAQYAAYLNCSEPRTEEKMNILLQKFIKFFEC